MPWRGKAKMSDHSGATLIETVRRALARLGQGRSTLQSNRLVERLQEKTGLTIIEIRRGLNALREAGEIECRDWSNGEPYGKVRLALCAPPASDAAITWRKVLEARQLPPEDVTALIPLHGALLEFDSADMDRLVEGLLRLRAEQKQFVGEPRFNVSAKFLLGSSKLLDALPTAALRSFGIDKTQFERFAGYIVVAGPPHPAACVLVENPHAFETAVSTSGTDDVAWIVTFGHGLSVYDEDYGTQLAEFLVIRSRLPNPLIRKGSPPDISSLLRHESLFFWGDLDPEGLRVFERIKGKWNHLRLSGLYQPLIDALGGTATSHPYVPATGKAGQAPWDSSDPFVARLMSLCSQHGVDQEVVDADAIARLCRLPITDDI